MDFWRVDAPGVACFVDGGVLLSVYVLGMCSIARRVKQDLYELLGS